ncbi:unnamed protein product [Discosporangium mesarthrocarpum]
MACKTLFFVAVALCLALGSAFIAPTSFATKATALNRGVQMSATNPTAAGAIAASPILAALTMGAPAAFADSEALTQLPTQLLSLEVQFGAYLAVLLGTLLPVLFLVLLYIQSESRKAGQAEGK